MSIFDADGRRLYFTDDERKAFMKAAAEQPRDVRTFCGVLHYTGCRISEALEITLRSIDLSARVVIFRSLKKRKQGDRCTICSKLDAAFINQKQRYCWSGEILHDSLTASGAGDFGDARGGARGAFEDPHGGGDDRSVRRGPWPVPT